MAGTNTITASVNGTTIDIELEVEIDEPAAPDLIVSTLTSAESSITTDQNTLVTLQLKDQFGNPRTTDDGTMTFSTTVGGFGGNNGDASVSADYVSDGRYEATLFASYDANTHGVGDASITAEADFTNESHADGTFGDNPVVTITEGLPNLAQSTITADPVTMTTDETSTITVQMKDHLGNHIQHDRGAVALSATIGSLNDVTNNEDGTYNATLSGDTRGVNGTGTATITGTFTGTGTADSIDGNLTDEADVEITEGAPALAQIEISTEHSTITADESTTVTVQLKDQFGNLIVNDRGPVTCL